MGTVMCTHAAVGANPDAYQNYLALRVLRAWPRPCCWRSFPGGGACRGTERVMGTNRLCACPAGCCVSIRNAERKEARRNDRYILLERVLLGSTTKMHGSVLLCEWPPWLRRIAPRTAALPWVIAENGRHGEEQETRRRCETRVVAAWFDTSVHAPV